MQLKQKIVDALWRAILFIPLAGIYLYSMAPGLTWANFGADGGDLIAAAATGGVAHPTGYPVYLLSAWLFQHLPVGSLAFRTNLLSALCTVLAAWLVYELVIHNAPVFQGYKNQVTALASGYAFGLAPLVWSQAVITEVYGLHALFVAAILYLSTVDFSKRFKPNNLDCLLGLVLGIATGNHITSVFLFPVLFFRKISRKSEPLSERSKLIAGWRVDIRGVLLQLVSLGMGLLVYLSIPLRSLGRPPVNWGNPITLSGFFWLISGKIYQNDLFVLTFSSVLERCKAVAALILGQFGVIGLLFGLLGLIVFFRNSHLYQSMFWIMGVSIAFSVIYATSDSFLYLIPALLCFAISMGMGLSGIVIGVDQYIRKGSIAISLIFIFILFIQAGNNWSQVDASHDQRAEQFGRDVLSQAPEHAIVFAQGDRAVFALWYFQFALHSRPDISIVAVDLLQYEWYQENLRTNYPDLNVPGPYPFAGTLILVNPARPKCYVEYRLLPQIQCLSAQD